MTVTPEELGRRLREAREACRMTQEEVAKAQAIRRGSFSNVKELVMKIQRFVETYNEHTSPFVWTATAESILAKVERLCLYISGTRH